MATQALVLSGGGVVDIAWETGIAKGLLDGGIDVAETDLIVGTSAGSVLGSQLACGRSLSELLAALFAPDAGASEEPIEFDPAAIMAMYQKFAGGAVGHLRSVLANRPDREAVQSGLYDADQRSYPVARTQAFRLGLGPWSD